MTLSAIVIFSLGVLVLLLYFLAEALFELIFAGIGAFVVWLLSFGRVRIDTLDAELATALGVIVFVVVGGVGCYMFQR